jgi:hypothetical protein
MILALVLAPTAHRNAMQAENNTEAQVSYTRAIDKVQVKTRTRIADKPRIVGLECQCRVGTLHPEISRPGCVSEGRSTQAP